MCETLAQVYAHSGLEIDSPVLEAAAARLHAPTYYRPRFSDEERAMIASITAPVASRFGYAVTGDI